MLVSETHICSRSYNKLHGYDIHRIPTHPADRKRGGSAILIKSCLQCYQFYSLQSPNVQCVPVKVKTDLGETAIASIYCPPNFQYFADDFEKLFDDLGTNFIIAGDWNAHHRLWGSRNSSTRGRALLDFIQRTNVQVLTTGGPTHYPYSHWQRDSARESLHLRKSWTKLWTHVIDSETKSRCAKNFPKALHPFSECEPPTLSRSSQPAC